MDPMQPDLDEFGDHDSNGSFSDSSESSDDEDEEMISMIIVVTTLDLFITCSEAFQSIELSRENQRCVIGGRGVPDVASSLGAIPQSLKDITNFWPHELEELCGFVCPLIASNARHTGGSHVLRGRPPKLTPQQRLLSFILYLKHDNTLCIDAQRWNISRSQVCLDTLFVASCVNEGIAKEIRWPIPEERCLLGQDLPEMPRCIGFVDGTLCKVRRPFENQLHRKWFQGRKKMYCLNSTILVDHNGLFMYVDPGYPGSYHDMTILRNSMVEVFWTRLFTQTDGYCEYVLGDTGYVGAENYVMMGFNKTEVRMLGLNTRLAKLFNKMHSGYRVKVEWDIGGLKMKWKRLGKRFDLTQSKFVTVFRSAALMTNFLHRRRMDMSWEIVDERGCPEDGGWAGDY